MVGTAEPSEAETLSGLIGLIYDCAVDPDRWLQTLTEIRHALGFCNAMFTIWKAATGEPLLNITSGIAPDYVALLPQFGGDVVEQWGGPAKIASYAVGDPKILSWERPRAEWTDSRYYRDWIEPQGIDDFMAVAVTRDSGTYCSVGFARHQDAGAIGQREIQLARLLVPHIQRAVAISRVLEIQTLAASSFSAALDAMSAGVVLVDEQLRVIAANRAGEALMAAGDCIGVDGGAVHLKSAAATRALQLAVTQARADETRIGGRPSGIPTERADGSPGVVHILPLQHGRLRPKLSPRAVAALFLAAASGPPPAPNEVISALFDLTPAETRVFAAIAAGRTVSETAQALGVSVVTTKTHLLRLFAKTGTRRQVDLVRLAGSLAVPA